MSHVLLSVTGKIATITLNRPERYNALTHEMWRDIGGLFTHLADNREIRVVLLTGAGNNFCAGADLDEVALGQLEAGKRESYLEAVEECCANISALGKPVIAVLNGYCLGGGVLLALACDFRFADEKLRFGIPAAKISVVYSVQGTRMLAALVGLAEAKRILYSGARFDAGKGAAIGFIDEIADDPLTRAFGYAQELVQSAPLTIAGAKYILNGSALDSFDPRRAQRHIEEAYRSRDHREGLAAAALKRPPKFQGM